MSICAAPAKLHSPQKGHGITDETAGIPISSVLSVQSAVCGSLTFQLSFTKPADLNNSGGGILACFPGRELLGKRQQHLFREHHKTI